MWYVFDTYILGFLDNKSMIFSYFFLFNGLIVITLEHIEELVKLDGIWRGEKLMGCKISYKAI